MTVQNSVTVTTRKIVPELVSGLTHHVRATASKKPTAVDRPKLFTLVSPSERAD
jgi:hypothetical protein